MTPAGRVAVGDIDIDALDAAQALAKIADLVQARRGGCVFTPNVDHIMRARRSAPYRNAYAQASMALADGMPVVWAARLLGHRLPAKVSGSTLLEPLLAMAASRNFSVYFVGGRAGACDKVAELWQARDPPLRVAGRSPPTRLLAPQGHVALSTVQADIRRSRADLVLVSLSAPEQEIWAAAACAELAPAVLVCTGSAVDMLAGLIPRPPPALSRAGLEWAWRLVREPKRLRRRYLVDDPPFFALIARQWLKQRRLRRSIRR